MKLLLLIASLCYPASYPTSRITTEGMQVDAFGNISVTEPTPEISLTFAYGLITDVTSVTYTGNGSSSTSAGIMQLNVTGANGSATMFSRRSIRYTPGQGIRALFTAIFSPCVANSTQTIGIQSRSGADGFALGCNGTEFGLLRSSGGYHTWIASSSWNGVPFNLDPQKGNVYGIQYQWLGFGKISLMAEDQSGNWITLHEIKYANTQYQTSVFNPSLSLRASVVNHSNTSAISIKTPSMGAYRAGPSQDVTGLHMSTSVYKAGLSAEVPILTVCSTTTYEGQNSRTTLIPHAVSIANESSKPSTVRIVREMTLTGPTFKRPKSNSFAMVDLVASAATGGTELLSVFLGKSDSFIFDMDMLHERIPPGECITFTGSTPTATADIGISVHWDEAF